ncbi:MAG TPA: chaperone modulator CbpM [Steroidobacteraceae bacterium]|nr:chaperone modulator CbpM [Steroidobacteraceae bacterium]
MTTNGERIFEARVVDETTSLHVDELCARLRIERQWIVELVELGALEPRGGSEPSAWAFPLADVPRLRTMARLVEDLGVNLPGAAIILDLVEERRRLLAQLRQWTTESG